MIEEPCADLWKVSAQRDGRLDVVDGARVDDHVSRCRECAAEKGALDVLYATMRSVTFPPTSPFVRARETRKLLARADARLVGRERKPSMVRRTLMPCAIALAGVAAIAWGASTRGTTAGRPVEVLTARPDPSAMSLGSATAVETPLSSASTSASMPSSASASASAVRGAPSHAAEPHRRRAGERYDEAVGAFSRGEYVRADRLLGEFVSAFPADERCEDAAYLRAIALARLGDDAGARARASEYLRAYPRGLRRSEAALIAKDSFGSR